MNSLVFKEIYEAQHSECQVGHVKPPRSQKVKKAKLDFRFHNEWFNPLPKKSQIEFWTSHLPLVEAVARLKSLPKCIGPGALTDPNRFQQINNILTISYFVRSGRRRKHDQNMMNWLN